MRFLTRLTRWVLTQRRSAGVYTPPATPPIASGTFAPPSGNVDEMYVYDASALFTGGAPTSYALATGMLPAGMTFSTATAVFGGTPTTEETEAGLSVSATNADGTDTTNTASIVIDAALVPVDWISLTANGEDGVTDTTILTVTFDVDPDTLVLGNYSIEGATIVSVSGGA